MIVFDCKLHYSQEEMIESMIKNPLEANDASRSDLVTIHASENEEIECMFQKFYTDSALHSVESVMAQFTLTSSYREYDIDEVIVEDIVVAFDIYGSNMIPANHIICDDAFRNVVSNIAKITGRKYTFHSCDEPCFTITKDKTIFFQENC